jgi:hypothetical protein
MKVYMKLVMIVKAVNFATSNDLTIESTMFPHHNIHKYIRMSPDGNSVALTILRYIGEGTEVHLIYDHSGQQTVILKRSSGKARRKEATRKTEA